MKQIPAQFQSNQPLLEDSSAVERLALLARLFWTVCGVSTLLTGCAVISSLAQLLSGFRGTRLCLNVIHPKAAHWSLQWLGVEVTFHGFEALSNGPFIVLGNHSSTLDLFILSCLPVPDKRAFLTRRILRIPPVALLARCGGAFLTPPQSERQARVACFQRAERILRNSQDSVFLSPEGTRYTDGSVGPFNKGAFHLATRLGWPILPVYIDIPKRINPGKGWLSRPGKVHVHAHPTIGTESWKECEIELNRDAVRSIYLAFPRNFFPREENGRPLEVESGVVSTSPTPPSALPGTTDA